MVKKAIVGDPLDPKTQIGPIANKNHYENLGFRSEFIREEFCLKKKDSWLSKGWLVESNSESLELFSIVGKPKMEFPGQADQLQRIN